MEGTIEFFGALIGLGLVILVIVLPLIALVRAGRAARLAKQNQENWQKLTQRVHALEKQAEEFQLQATQQKFALEMALQQIQKSAAGREAASSVEPAPAPISEPIVEAAGGQAPYCEPPRPTAVVTPPPSRGHGTIDACWTCLALGATAHRPADDRQAARACRFRHRALASWVPQNRRPRKPQSAF